MSMPMAGACCQLAGHFDTPTPLAPSFTQDGAVMLVYRHPGRHRNSYEAVPMGTGAVHAFAFRIIGADNIARFRMVLSSHQVGMLDILRPNSSSFLARNSPQAGRTVLGAVDQDSATKRCQLYVLICTVRTELSGQSLCRIAHCHYRLQTCCCCCMPLSLQSATAATG